MEDKMEKLSSIYWNVGKMKIYKKCNNKITLKISKIKQK